MMDFDKLAVENFRKYLRIPTAEPNVNYAPVVSFLRSIASDLNLHVRTYQYHPDNPIVLLSWFGSDPNLPSILLNSHMDTVSANEKVWDHPPFAAEMDVNGNIYGRGAQDCKSVGVLHLEAIRRLKNDNIRLRRTVHILFVPDEELGGNKGMGAFTQSSDFKELNVGFAMDEAMHSSGNKFLISYGERICWTFLVHCEGTTGHGSLLLKNTAGEKVALILAQFYKLRHEQIKKLTDDHSLALGDVISINLTQMEGGLQSNIIPHRFSLGFDCRLPPNTDVSKFESKINGWCQEAGEGVTVQFLLKETPSPLTVLDDTNKYWTALKDTIIKLDIPFETIILPATTDSYYLRKIGIPSVGFVPFRYAPILEHNINEYLNAKTLLEGIDIYTKILPALANV